MPQGRATATPLIGSQRGSQPREETTRRRILSIGAELFQERGYERTSMNAIAERVGITAPGLYWHFGSKEEILAECLEQALVGLRDYTAPALRKRTSVAQLHEFTRLHVLYQLEQFTMSAVFGSAVYGFSHLTQSLDEDRRGRLVALQREHLHTLVGILEAGRAEERFRLQDVTAAAFAILAMGEHVIYWFRADGPLSPGELAAQYADLASRMVAA
jgi:AcrR family transcriptional regulator